MFYIEPITNIYKLFNIIFKTVEIIILSR